MAALDAQSLNNHKPDNMKQIDNSYQNWQEYVMPTLKNHSMQYVNWKLDEMDVNRIIIGDGNFVIDQYPQPDETAGTKQNVFVKTDGNNYTMPNMLGWSYKDVILFKEISGLPIQINGQGTVVWQNISANDAIFMESDIKVSLE